MLYLSAVLKSLDPLFSSAYNLFVIWILQNKEEEEEEGGKIGLTQKERKKER